MAEIIYKENDVMVEIIYKENEVIVEIIYKELTKSLWQQNMSDINYRL